METRCTCGQGHPTFGACMRAKSIRVGWSNSAKGLDLTEEKNKQRDLAIYKSARDQGIQPGSTDAQSARFALDVSDQMGTPFRADDYTSIAKDL